MKKLLLLAILPLIAAYFVEWHGLAHPCKFCYYERYIFMAIILVAVIGIVSKLETNNLLGAIILGILLLGIGITCYHIGIEQGWIKDAGSCTSGGVKDSFSAFKKAIEGKDLVACDQPYYIYKGITLAQLNLFYLSGLVVYLLIFKRSRR